MPQDAATALLKGAYDKGCRHFDTAEVYKTGNPMTDDDDGIYNEAVIAPFLASVPRADIVVATKFFPFKWGNNCDYDTVKKALQGSLARLGLAYVDVYYCHRIPSLEACLAFVAAGKRLAADGLLRHVGLSEVCGAWLRKAHAVHPIACVQQEWSLLTRNAEELLIPACIELGAPSPPHLHGGRVNDIIRALDEDRKSPCRRVLECSLPRWPLRNRSSFP